MSLRSPREPADTFVVPEKKPAQPVQNKAERWAPSETPGIERNGDGRLRTNLPETKGLNP